MALIIKKYYCGTNIFRFEFAGDGFAFIPAESFEVQKLGEKQYSIETSDETAVFPSTVELEIDDFSRIVFDNLKAIINSYKFEAGKLNFEYAGYVTIYKNNEMWFKGIVSKVTNLFASRKLKVQISSASDKLKTPRVDNPYLIRALMDTGDLQGEALRNTAGEIFSDCWAFGRIREFNRQAQLGFIIYKRQSNQKPVLSLGVEEEPEIHDPLFEQKIGVCNFMNFMNACLRMLNPGITLTIKHNWKFGPEEKTIEELEFNEVYRYIFGRMIIISRGVYDTLHNDIFDSQQLRDSAELVWKDDYWVAWKINIAGSLVTGAGERSLLGNLRNTAKGFYSRITFKDLDNVTMFKKGYVDNIEVSPDDVLSEPSLATQLNKIEYVKIDWQGKQVAERGSSIEAVESYQRLEYSINFAAAEGTVTTFIVPGFGGLPGGSTVNIILPSYGNLFYRHNGNRVFAVAVKDPEYPAITRLVELIAELEYNTKNKNRGLYDYELWGVDYSLDENYSVKHNGYSFGNAQPAMIRINEEKNKTVISGNEVI